MEADRGGDGRSGSAECSHNNIFALLGIVSGDDLAGWVADAGPVNQMTDRWSRGARWQPTSRSLSRVPLQVSSSSPTTECKKRFQGKEWSFGHLFAKVAGLGRNPNQHLAVGGESTIARDAFARGLFLTWPNTQIVQPASKLGVRTATCVVGTSGQVTGRGRGSIRIRRAVVGHGGTRAFGFCSESEAFRWIGRFSGEQPSTTGQVEMDEVRTASPSQNRHSNRSCPSFF